MPADAATSSRRKPRARQIDYAIIFARDMRVMRDFYERIMGFAVDHELGPKWVSYRLAGTVFTLTERGLMFDDPPTPCNRRGQKTDLSAR